MAVTARITTAGFDSAPPKPCRAQVLEPEVVSGGAASDAMVVATVVLSRSAARYDVIHEHELADVLTRAERGN